MLVFRDGHKEEIESYVIIGAFNFTGTDGASTGSRTRKLAIADLDVPATLKLNREHGGEFTLAFRPNKVVVWP